MLSWKIMKATEAACYSVCMGEEASEHYGYAYTRWDRWCAWWQGFVTGWVDDWQFIPLRERISLKFQSLVARYGRAPVTPPDR